MSRRCFYLFAESVPIGLLPVTPASAQTSLSTRPESKSTVSEPSVS
ncbi:MAG: hypothetical protein AAGA83_17135 [Cyanobacteria bacterium P01_F01_bin.116]